MAIEAAGKAAIAFGVVFVFLSSQFIREMDPIGGSWSVVDGTIDGEPLARPEASRIYLEIDGRRHANLRSLWTCGVVENAYAYGHLERKGGHVLIYGEDRQGNPTPWVEAELQELPNRRLRFEVPNVPEGKVVVVLKREDNLVSVFDLFGWH